MPFLSATLTLLAAYFVGAIPFGYLVARWKGVDIFAHGSGNIGATNVGRVLGRPLGFLVFLLDFAKGAGPVALASLLRSSYSHPLWTGGYVEVAAGLTAFLGHLFPIYLRFHGGKGVATGAGAVAVLLPIPALVAFGVWTAVLCATRLMSLASIAAVFALGAAHFRFSESLDWIAPRSWFCLVAGVLVLVKHRANIGRLLNGTENQLKESVLMQQLTRSLHVCALGMWFGMSLFFTFVVALTLFGAFDQAALKEPRDLWFPLPTMLLEKRGDIEAMKEQGSRAAGHAVTPLLTWYFLLQGVCGFLALATALAWVKEPSSVHRWRVNLLTTAIVFVLAGWWLDRRVHDLREPRNQTMEAYLQDRTNPDKIAAKDEARAAFGLWHTYSLFANFATIVCVSGAMALAGNLGTGSLHPAEKKPEPTAPTETP